MRTHVVLPDELVNDIDELVGKRKRSAFIVETIEERVKREMQLKAIREGAGSLDLKKYPHWSTREKTEEWVRALRSVPSSYDKRVAREKRSASTPTRHKRVN